MPTPKLTTEIILAAITGFESQKDRIDVQIAELRAMLPGNTTESALTPKGPIGKRRKMSSAARKRMGDAQRRRWAEARGEAESPSSPVTPSRPKRKLSAAGRRAISEAMKKRWAATAKTAPAPAKKAAKKKWATLTGAALTAAKKTSGKGPRKKATKAPTKTVPEGVAQ